MLVTSAKEEMFYLAFVVCLFVCLLTTSNYWWDFHRELRIVFAFESNLESNRLS